MPHLLWATSNKWSFTGFAESHQSRTDPSLELLAFSSWVIGWWWNWALSSLKRWPAWLCCQTARQVSIANPLAIVLLKDVSIQNVLIWEQIASPFLSLAHRVQTQLETCASFNYMPTKSNGERPSHFILAPCQFFSIADLVGKPFFVPAVVLLFQFGVLPPQILMQFSLLEILLVKGVVAWL